MSPEFGVDGDGLEGIDVTAEKYSWQQGFWNTAAKIGSGWFKLQIFLTTQVLPFIVAPEGLAVESGASSALQGARLGEHLTQLEKYGAQGFKELENGSIRYYGDLKAATTPGDMSGARLVREWNPITGSKRTWLETLDQDGAVRSVRPETGGPKIHYTFDANGNYTGTR